jgi:hypothetical protein
MYLLATRLGLPTRVGPRKAHWPNAQQAQGEMPHGITTRHIMSIISHISNGRLGDAIP